MISRAEVIEIVKKICEENKNINLSIAEIGIASWKHLEENMELSETQAKDVGRVSALSLVFDIISEDL